MKALQSMASSLSWSASSMMKSAVAFAVAAGMSAMFWGCGGSDTRQVNNPPPQKSAPVSASGANSAQGASSALGGATSSRALRQDLVAGQQQIDRTLASLRTLSNPSTTDLRAAYDDYSTQLVRMTDHAEKLKREADAMRASRNEYFAQWEEKVSAIDNPTIRATAEARRNKLRESHERIATEAGQARDAYESFMRDLQDVRKFLGGDLSKQSVSMLGDVQRKAAGSGGTVKEKLDVIIAELDAIDAGTR
jgi:Protein of unknown function (DUF2959)